MNQGIFMHTLWNVNGKKLSILRDGLTQFSKKFLVFKDDNKGILNKL